MNEFINYGIDLGTTNSAIAHYHEGKVRIIKNPKSFKEIMPSAVAFRNGRTFMGDKAIELLSNGHKDVYTGFKREMGTDRKFDIKDVAEFNAIDLSAFVLKELLAFEQDQNIDAAVITIPASFDIVQSNATKKAGENAGLQSTVLLQEPIAACLAYANENQLDISKRQNWLVYDFGGGTFDSALVQIDNREMNVKDHLGNNFLGGMDIDKAIMNKLILKNIKNYNDLASSNSDDKTISQDFKKYVLHKIEEMKKELSISQSAFVELDYPALDILEDLRISRAELDEVVKPYFFESLKIINDLLLNNNLSFQDIDRIIMVGGTTYIPYIRQQLSDVSGTKVDFSIDPTTAIVKGAAYFAGTKLKEKNTENSDEPTNIDSQEIEIELFYENTSNDPEELIGIKCSKGFKGQLRIINESNGYNSGQIKFNDEYDLFVPIGEKQINNLVLEVWDKKDNLVKKQNFSISHGVYNILGQTIPLDICLEVDDAEDGTKLEPIFKKNSLLPLKRSVRKNLSKTIMMGTEDQLIINVLEGRSGTLPASNLSIGKIIIDGRTLSQDLIKGTDIVIDFTISESRDLKIEVFVPSSEILLKESFSPNEKIVDRNQLEIDIRNGINLVSQEIELADKTENYEISLRFASLKDQLQTLLLTIELSDHYDLYELDEKKRSILKEVDRFNSTKYILEEIEMYNRVKKSTLDIDTPFNETDQKTVNSIFDKEIEFLNSRDKHLIRSNTDKLWELRCKYFFMNDKNYANLYIDIKFGVYLNIENPPLRIQKMFEEADEALKDENYAKLKGLTILIYNSLDFEKVEKNKFNPITGLK